MKRQNIRTLFLIIGTFTYLLCGASFFDYAESKHEKMQRTALNTIESMILRKYNISKNDLRILTTVVIKNVPHKAGVQWKFSGAFYFATTVLTTIDYGHSTPATYLGKSFCMIYALMGIPLGLIMFQSIGERLNTFVAYALRFCKRCLGFKEAKAAQDINSIPLSDKCLIISVSIISTLVMTIGAAVFSAWENWTYFDAFYYCFITLTTIGFGDYVALQKNSALQDKPEYVIFSLVFILFGLSVVSAAINLLVLRFLTMNTEDERRDEAEAALTAASGVRLESDVITANGSIISGIIPMENYLHNTSSAHPFSARYHVYNYPPSAKAKKQFSKHKVHHRTNQSDEADDLFSEQEGLDGDELTAGGQPQIGYYQNQESHELHDSELTETSPSQPVNRVTAYIQKQTIISDSGSERTFNAHLNQLKAHQLTYSEHSEASFSSGRASQHKSNGAKRRTSKVFCKTSSDLLGKQQRKNYKHMVSDDDDESEMNSELMSEPVQTQANDDFYEEDDDRASVCSCTCYGNSNQSSGWKTSKNKKTKNQAKTNQSNAAKSTQNFILNRKASSSNKKHKNQSSAKSTAKYKNLAKQSQRNQLTQGEQPPPQQFDLNQLNRLKQLNQMQNADAETIPLPPYYHPQQQAPIFLNIASDFERQRPPQQYWPSTNETLVIDKQTQRFVVQAPASHLQPHDLASNPLLCNLEAAPSNPISNLTHSDLVLNQLNAINAQNLAYFIDNEKRMSIGQQLLEQQKQIIELKEKQSTRRTKEKSPKDLRKRKASQSVAKSRTAEKHGSTECLLKRSNEAFVLENQQHARPADQHENAEVKSDFSPIDQEGKLHAQRASI